MALTSDFLQGNILDQLKELRRRVEELERGQKALAGRTDAGGGGGGQQSGLATRLFLQDGSTGEWWRLLAVDDSGMEYIDLLRVRDDEVR